MARSAEELQSAFARLIGRQPSDVEVARLVQIRDALGIRENDALWDVLMALELYDAGFRRYPTLIASETERALQLVRQQVGELARSEARRAHVELVQSVADTSERLAAHKAKASLWLASGWAVAISAVFAGCCLAAGFVLGSGSAPWWFRPAPATSAAGNLLRMVMQAPVGWVVIVAAGIAVPSWWISRLTSRPRVWQLAACAGLVLTACVALVSLFA
ncbi:hypothetical protein [Dyella ginsengisoli]|uniref:hypothetical protein n=1 Tax=Dyella ginsengisoli TaxID=363848 RepID=UPI00037A9A5B|nr:hypothetical protein [Dyella ginsengisoli]